ncbi:hypothetical protein GE300_02715 [Rhodobacteraceae bacterium 2CG4]|uniref:PH (Pleckstrin Homology) domain-containing protein n=1 Tax=Halovulum marinum TaxID=2662447 RepID=A0A6L5YX31_9RHOB|nr:hypothetical protein [Halovulum marinum]MSU88530.1 hypothetical protein [Halovulum marinum]
MRILHDDNARLVVAHRPGPVAWLCTAMGAALLALAATGAGSEALSDRLIPGSAGLGLLVLAWACFPATRTVFSRAEGLAVHEEHRLLHRRLKAVPLDRIRGAQVEASWSDAARLTRLTLRTADGPLPLERSYGNDDRRALETAINEWLTRPFTLQPAE